MTTYISIFVAIISFSVIVLVHEIGHLVAAKKNGIFVEEFALGMGPRIFKKQVGETLYTVRAFPLGGFCKMLGEDGESSDPRSFASKRPMQRFVVIIAGAVLNFVFGFLLLIVLTAITGFSTTTVSEALEGSPAQNAGIVPGERIVSIAGRKIGVFEDMSFALAFSKGKEVEVITEENGEMKIYHIVPQQGNQIGVMNGEPMYRYYMGIIPVQYSGVFEDSAEFEKAGVAGIISNSVSQLSYYIRTTYDSLKMLVTGTVSLKELSGFVGIGGVYVESIEAPMDAKTESGGEIPLGIRLRAAMLNVLSITVLISINLGVMNLLPLPALDGGRAVFILIEAVRGKPFNPEREGAIHFAGFALLMLLMVFVTYNDIVKLISG